ncbi:MAG: serpin family protein [Streptosporangiaceae bacterium]
MKKRGAAAGLAVTAAALMVAGCGSARPAVPEAPVIVHGVAFKEPIVSPRPYGAADTAFGLSVLGAWCATDPSTNLVLSPSSLASGLGMAYLGARGGTAQAMAGVLRLPATGGQALEAGLQARSAALRDLDGPGVTVSSTDQVWDDPSVQTLRSYLNAVATGYGAGVAHAPLLSNSNAATKEINQAIATATRGHIPELLEPGMLQDDAWVLTDALYLQAAWATPFQAEQTYSGPFTTAAGRQASVNYMHGEGYRVFQMAGWTAVSLPYRDGKLAMVALLPPSGAASCAMPAASALGTMTTTLTGHASAAGLSEGDAIALPKVNLSTRVSLKDLLSRLGMGVAFTSAADFSGLSPQACCIGLVEQAATLQVGEKGTVATAATAVGILPSSARVASRQITFDRPYLMLVTDTSTGEPLLMARVANPAAR